MPLLDDLKARAAALGIDFGALWATLKPIVIKMLLDFLEGQLAKKAAAEGCDHCDQAVTSAATGQILCIQGQHIPAAEHFFAAAASAFRCVEEGDHA